MSKKHPETLDEDIARVIDHIQIATNGGMRTLCVRVFVSYTDGDMVYTHEYERDCRARTLSHEAPVEE